ncbi:tandem-95 repeat protein, partial [Chengkuizengella axinellae]
SKVIYTPADGYNGSDTFTFTVTDLGDGTAEAQTSEAATITITVNPVNSKPQADEQTVETNEGEFTGITLTGNDEETNSSDLIFNVDEDSIQNGTLVVEGSKVTYTPADGYNGPDSFTFTVTDTGDGSAEAKTSEAATVTITVNPVNTKPEAANQAVETNEGKSIEIILTGSDEETDSSDLIFNVDKASVQNGTLVVEGSKVTYTPADRYNGEDSFTFTVTDLGDGTAEAQTSEAATVTITVNPVNTKPEANNQTVIINEREAVEITLTGSDTETPSSDLIFNVDEDSIQNGTITVEGSKVIYTSADGYNGPDSFTFTVTDLGDGSAEAKTSDSATVTITINPVNSKPVADNQTAIINEGETVEITLTGSDEETDSSDLIFNVDEASVQNGTITIEGSKVIYTPADGYNGEDSFTFTVTDLGDGSAEAKTSEAATITITVNPVNTKPVAANQAVETN